jgi:hypothetical protein
MSRPSRSDPVSYPSALTLNPEAGSHSVCDNPEELAAALRAGERTWETFPYYAQRYGDRGRAFTRSDSAWIVTLVRSPGTVDAQVLWLGSVLASRGMPRWLLEVHLEHLHEELAGALPGRRGVYASLQRAAEMLARRRRAQIPDAAFQAIERALDERADRAWIARLPRTGALIAAAVADERDGISRAVPSLAAWLADQTRFSERWVEAALRTIEEARAVR